MALVDVPEGLPATTADKLSKLARLIMIAQEQPDALRLTNEVLMQHLQSKRRVPTPIDEPSPQSNESISLRGTI